MVYLPEDASGARLREAEHARRNRLEIVQALSQGQITKRDLFRWGILTAGGLLALKNGLSPFARSAYAAVPTGTPRSPLFGATKFSQRMPRTPIATPVSMIHLPNGDCAWGMGANGRPYNAERPAKKYSYHHYWSDPAELAQHPEYRTLFANPVTGRGPCEGRPPGDHFAHQRWEEMRPKVGYSLSIAPVKSGSKFHPLMAEQQANAMWCFADRTAGLRGNPNGLRLGSPVPLLIKARYGEPMVTRIYNDLPVNRALNGGFGRNEPSTHFHNAHNGAESDGACNAFHFPGTFYDYHWATALARRDMPSRWLTSDPKHLDKASGPDNGDGLVRVPGDFRELQGTMWFHDHRFFFTAENVHKGMFGFCNFYSGPDRGRDDLNDGINLRLPSGNRLPWGNTDFDVNIAISNPATDQQGQLFYDIFDTEGFLGDMLLCNGAYAPYMEVLPRRYRFRILNGSVSRFIKLMLAVHRSSRFASGTVVPVHFIANDGNLIVRPVKLSQLDIMGVAERFDFVVDFSAFRPGDVIRMVNVLKHEKGERADDVLTLSQALRGDPEDPAVGEILEFRVVSSVRSVDDPTKTWTLADQDKSTNLDDPDWASGLKTLTSPIPIVAPVRVRQFTWGKSGDGTSLVNGQCIPECGDKKIFPYSVRVNGQTAHTANAARISALIPRPGETEHWILENAGTGWDHPIHVHFEESVTIDRNGAFIPVTEQGARKDVWRLRPGGTVRIQVTFGEFGGAYVNHCHNTTHEDFAMLMRFQLLRPGTLHGAITKTPMPTPDGVTWKDAEVLPEADPNFSWDGSG